MKYLVKNFFNFFIRLFGLEMFMYLIFGGLTTLINIIVFYICTLLSFSTALSTTVAFIISVIFAYVTNRKWVFNSKASKPSEILSELWKFFSVRIFTYFADLILMILLVDKLYFNKLACKIGVNLLVIVLNYIASKVIVFRKGKK